MLWHILHCDVIWDGEERQITHRVSMRSNHRAAKQDKENWWKTCLMHNFPKWRLLWQLLFPRPGGRQQSGSIAVPQP